MLQGADGLDGYLEYNTDLFEPATIDGLGSCRTIVRVGVGFDNVDLDAARRAFRDPDCDYVAFGPVFAMLGEELFIGAVLGIASARYLTF